MYKIITMETKHLMFFITIVTTILLYVFIYRHSQEGLIMHNKNTANLNQVYIPEYSETFSLFKLYDSVYFDIKNNNIIELFGIPFSESNNSNLSTNETLTDIILMQPSDKNNQLAISRHTRQNGILQVKPEIIHRVSLRSALEPTGENYKAFKNLNYNYQIVYIELNDINGAKLLHIYDCIDYVHIGTYMFSRGVPSFSKFLGGIPSNIGPFLGDDDTKNNTFISEPLYDKAKLSKTFQISKNFLFDVINHTLILKKNKALTVFGCKRNSFNQLAFLSLLFSYQQ